MNIKPIDEFTLEECWSYLEQNAEGEMAAAVRQRVGQLRAIERKAAEKELKRQERDRERQEAKRAERVETFLKEFDRFFVTQRYPEAFQRALIAFVELGPLAIIREKAEKTITKLSDYILFPDKLRVDSDWMIDVLSKEGYRKMSLQSSTRLSITRQIEACYYSFGNGGRMDIDIDFWWGGGLYSLILHILTLGMLHISPLIKRKKIRNILAEALIEEAIRIHKTQNNK